MELSGPQFSAHLLHALSYVNVFEMIGDSESQTFLKILVISSFVLFVIEIPLIVYYPSPFNTILNVSGAICVFALSLVWPHPTMFHAPFVYVNSDLIFIPLDFSSSCRS